MAVLTPTELTEVRQQVARDITPVTWTKAQVNAALQAIENYFETTGRAGLNTAIEGAAAGVFTAAQKKKLVAYYLLQKFRREGV